MDLEDVIYPGGFHALQIRLERREIPFKDADEEILPEKADLDELYARLVPAPGDKKDPEEKYLVASKWRDICGEFAGQPELFARHALLIAVLRRRAPPPGAQAMFLRMWREKGDVLARELPVRWLISAATTFADHGETCGQRLCGQGLSILFDLIKLHDSERRLSGRKNGNAFPKVKGRRRDGIAFGMQAYSLKNGDLDMNMLARLWRLAEDDAVVRPLGFRMLRMVMSDQRSIFGRIQKYKKRPSA